ncbi:MULTISPECIES: hypothetical protein [unclassified Inquilinus]|uniref:hypothetical protein n=1 Tax=unclassified Inquilinus TaxID=2645927 RepID=UPI003F8FF7A7
MNLAITINLDQEHEEIAKAAGKDLAAWAIKTFENCVHATCRELGIEAGENIAVLEQRGIFYEKGFWSFEGPLVDVEATESYAHSGERGFDLHAALRVDIDRESFRRCLGKHVAKRITGNRVAAQARTPSGQKSRAVTWKLDRENRVKVVEITTEAGGASGWVKYITKIATLTESYHNDVVERRPWRVSRGLTQRARRHLDLLVREFGPDAALGILDGMHAAQKEKERLRRRSSDQRPRKRPGRWR